VVLGGITAALSAGVTGAAFPAARRGFFARHRLPVGVQAYTVAEAVGRDPVAAFARLAAIGFREVELPGLLRRTPAELRAAADAAGLRIAALHLGAAGGPGNSGLDIASSADRISTCLSTLGADAAILSMMPLPAGFRPATGERYTVALARAIGQAGPDHWRRTADLLNRAAAALRPSGMVVGYHNHNVEFADMGGNTTGFDLLVRETEAGAVFFELDAGWVATAGRDPVRTVSSLRGRVRWMHVKDVAADTRANTALETSPVEVGGGTIDWARLLPVAYRAGVRHFFVEQEPPFRLERFASLERSYAYLANLA